MVGRESDGKMNTGDLRSVPFLRTFLTPLRSSFRHDSSPPFRGEHPFRPNTSFLSPFRSQSRHDSFRSVLAPRSVLRSVPTPPPSLPVLIPRAVVRSDPLSVPPPFRSPIRPVPSSVPKNGTAQRLTLAFALVRHLPMMLVAA